ncbi:hypothetical protein BT69DRAFT_1320157 [Atractiella rhizophila]|nr:hypothetical protein BT69DRAFT_1320157 [Atractiella rhizophila]
MLDPVLIDGSRALKLQEARGAKVSKVLHFHFCSVSIRRHSSRMHSSLPPELWRYIFTFLLPAPGIAHYREDHRSRDRLTGLYAHVLASQRAFRARLFSCALVCRFWSVIAQKLLFATTTLSIRGQQSVDWLDGLGEKQSWLRKVELKVRTGRREVYSVLFDSLFQHLTRIRHWTINAHEADPHSFDLVQILVIFCRRSESQTSRKFTLEIWFPFHYPSMSYPFFTHEDEEKIAILLPQISGVEELVLRMETLECASKLFSPSTLPMTLVDQVKLPFKDLKRLAISAHHIILTNALGYFASFFQKANEVRNGGTLEGLSLIPLGEVAEVQYEPLSTALETFIRGGLTSFMLDANGGGPAEKGDGRLMDWFSEMLFRMETLEKLVVRNLDCLFSDSESNLLPSYPMLSLSRLPPLSPATSRSLRRREARQKFLNSVPDGVKVLEFNVLTFDQNVVAEINRGYGKRWSGLKMLVLPDHAAEITPTS